MVLKQVLSMMVGSTCFFVGRDASGGKRGAGVTVMGAERTGRALFLFRCPEIRCSKKSAAGGGGGGT